MKRIVLILMCMLPLCVSSHAANEVVRIKLEWLNSKECGLEGCKPKAIIMREGGAMMFGWPDIKQREFFEVRPDLQEAVVRLNLKRLLKTVEEKMETIAEDDFDLHLDRPQVVGLGEVRLLITVTKEPDPEKKQTP